ncbi:MAG TPA: hypothetical protein VK536_06155 [Candidatus Limnocylindrales bacterium]|nr:hypothetical protein [Candidatus Limnocylindrales bacterium]
MNRKALLVMTLILMSLILAILSCLPVNAQNSSNGLQPAANNQYFFIVLAGIIVAAVLTAMVIIFCAPPDVLAS